MKACVAISQLSANLVFRNSWGEFAYLRALPLTLFTSDYSLALLTTSLRWKVRFFDLMTLDFLSMCLADQSPLNDHLGTTLIGTLYL